MALPFSSPSIAGQGCCRSAVSSTASRPADFALVLCDVQHLDTVYKQQAIRKGRVGERLSL